MDIIQDYEVGLDILHMSSVSGLTSTNQFNIIEDAAGNTTLFFGLNAITFIGTSSTDLINDFSDWVLN